MGLSITLKKMLLGKTFTTDKGRIMLFQETNWTLLPSRAFAINLQTIAEKKGGKYLYKLGYNAGLFESGEIKEHLKIEPGNIQKNIAALNDIMEFTGVGTLAFTMLKIKDGGHHHMMFHLENNPVVEHAARLYGPKSMVCNWFMGVYTAHIETFLGIKNSMPKENKCICNASQHCEFESKW
jgi:hypothetical protein